jgi:hypothetical protein
MRTAREFFDALVNKFGFIADDAGGPTFSAAPSRQRAGAIRDPAPGSVADRDNPRPCARKPG